MNASALQRRFSLTMSTTGTQSTDNHVSPQRAFDRLVWHNPRYCNGCFERIKEIEEADPRVTLPDPGVREPIVPLGGCRGWPAARLIVAGAHGRDDRPRSPRVRQGRESRRERIDWMADLEGSVARDFIVRRARRNWKCRSYSSVESTLIRPMIYICERSISSYARNPPRRRLRPRNGRRLFDQTTRRSGSRRIG
ncbi:hypothetical protein EA462_10100 [Natrarchaeobius halalkaliphilus]|uniref:Uncharacterized protein n=1 Tax=Natrarchaeobius halalkaliphilus TaxID=1679091 RepID=A0A3N6LMN4_9EURY|nr:hypothetical protein EA462_10100 [Natrarchaeobius halalkaliphilus]